MLYQESIASLVQANVADRVLYRKSTVKHSIRSLQVLLFKLGFGKELGWDKYRADGDYGGGTTKAVAAFLQKNGLQGNGEVVDTATAKLMLERYQLLTHMVRLWEALKANQMAPYAVATADENAIRGMQAMLNALGYGELMNFANVGAHGTMDQGTAAALHAFVKAEGRTLEGNDLDATIGRLLLEKVSTLYGNAWPQAQNRTQANQRRQSALEVSQNGNRIEAKNDYLRGRFTKYKRGLYTAGNEKASTTIQMFNSALKNNGMTESAIRVMMPVSKNEGNLDAVNTWDDSYISLGMFQWTLGRGGGKGELAALLKRLKDNDPSAFENYFGRYGLDVAPDTNEVNGYMSYNGTVLRSTSSKEQFRSIDWAFRFWEAGLDPRVQIVEILHGLSRIYSFYHHSSYTPLNKFYIDQLVTSEYGVALLLDHHVNRPGHLMKYAIGKKDIIGQAMKDAKLENTNPAQWTMNEEMALINAYIPLRLASSVTHADKRTDVVQSAFQRGELSAERGSFMLAPKTRSLGAATGAFPQGLKEEDYPHVSAEEYEAREEVPQEVLDNL
ncbi:MAG: peptidoglycan-binding domain-containing protein [Bacteroidota bacterium]